MPKCCISRARSTICWAVWSAKRKRAGAFTRRLRTNCERRFKFCRAKSRSRFRARARKRFYRETLEQLLGETGRLKGLVQDLLQLNALEMRQVQVACEPLDLREWADRALLGQCETVEQNELLLDARLETIEIEAPPAHLEILLRNLLENAVKYAVPGSVLRVDTCAHNAGAELQIWNACEVPAGADLSDWFEPFLPARRFARFADRRQRSGPFDCGGTGTR